MSVPSEYYLFYSEELFKNQSNSKIYKSDDIPRIIRYRRSKDENNNPVDDIVIITEACRVKEDESQADFLESFYKEKHNINLEKKYLGIGVWSSSLPRY